MSSDVSDSQDRIPLARSARQRNGDDTLSEPESLDQFSDVHAWVLIGDPGAGKTDVFETLSQAEGGYCTNARDFVALELPPDWTAPIFIDGLDEITAGNATGSTALEQIRTRLQKLGTPKFRISCREADWRGNTDSAALKRLVKDDSFLELHLAPLDLEQTKALIMHWQSSNDAAATQFIREAKRHDLEGLLDNPQTLRMLVKAIGMAENTWPDSKTRTYELACAQLVREHSDEHLAAKQNSPLVDDKILKAAGYLSAIMLLSGSAAIALRRSGSSSSGMVILPELVVGDTSPDLSTCQAALGTRLFRSRGNSEFGPVHRTVAEYLGAQYLVSRIHAGLPPNRVLALMLGQDDGVVPELRGLHAWLAAAATGDLRRALIDHDPLGVIINGDVRNFTRPEKLHVLNALRGEATRYTYFRSQNWASNPFGALATANMMEDFRALLESTDRSAPHQALIDCVLDALANGHHMPELAPELEQVVHDKTYRSRSREKALEILVTYVGKSDNGSTLTQLLADIHGNVVEDQEDELLGMLLQAVYPNHISPAEVWQYFRKPKSDQLHGSYRRFWHDLPKEKTRLTDIPVLLDALLETGYQLSSQHDHLGSSEIVGELLVQGVTQYGDQINVSRLFNWLSLGLDRRHHCPLNQEYKTVLAQWLGERPAIYKALFQYGLSLQASTNETVFHTLWQIRVRFYGAPSPDDSASWYLSLAEASAGESLRRQLVTESFQVTHQRNGADAAIELLENWSSANLSDASWVESFLRCSYPPPESEQEHIDFEIQHRKREADESRQKTNFFHETLPGFAEGPAHLGALMEVADAYLNLHRRSQETTPDARLLGLLNHETAWVSLALNGLRECLFRQDLPSALQIVDASTKGQRYNLATPCLAAMELRYSENPQAAFDLPPSTLETVSAFRLTNNYGETPAWFKQLPKLRPDILTTVMQQLIEKQIASKKEHVDGLYTLAHNADHAHIANRIVPILIENFPNKASKEQLQSLRLLIVAMLGRLERGVQLKLLASKLNTEGMDVAQRVYWLTAGVLLAPDVYLETARREVQKTQTRASHLFAMIHELMRDRGGLQLILSSSTRGFLIELLGPKSNPSWRMRSGRVTPEMEAGRYVEELIFALAGNPDDDAVQVLMALQQRHDLRHWEESFNHALYDQRIARRKALFKPASVAQVCATLANLKPANAADLWALTVDHLKQLAREIRDSNTDDYEQYWAGDSPNSEELCRNALLSALKRHLAPMSISAEPERLHPNAKRADIEVASGLHHIPVEAKGEWHKDLWKAIREQLIHKYGREPASDGYGVYLVFWFTGKLMPVAGDGGPKPKTPQELKQRLIATVPEALKNKIAVLVVDCSKPIAIQSAKKISP